MAKVNSTPKKSVTVEELHRDIIAGLTNMEQSIRGNTANQMEDLMQVQFNRGLLAATVQIRAETDRVFKEFLGLEAPETPKEEAPEAAESLQ